MSNLFKKTGKFLGFGMLAGVFVLIFGIYWQLGPGESADYDAVKEAIVQYGNDMNEMREYLYLPANNYDFFKASLTDANTDNLAIPEDTQYQTGVKMFAEALAKEQNLLKNQEATKAQMTTLLKESVFTEGLAGLKLTSAKKIDTDETYARVKIMNGQTALAQLLLNIKTKEYALQSIIGVQEIKVSKTQEAESIIDFLKKNKETIVAKKTLLEGQKSEFKTFLEDKAFVEILNKNMLSINQDPVETIKAFEYYFTDLNGSPLLTVLIDRETGNYIMSAVAYRNITELEPVLREKLKTISGETNEIKAIKIKKENLEKYLSSQEFKTEMKGNNIEISEGKQEANKVNYELSYSDTSEKLGTIIFDNITGNITFVDSKSGLESSLEEILSGSKKKP